MFIEAIKGGYGPEKSLFIKVLEAFSSIGGFSVFCQYVFSFFASYLNKWLYLSDLMQERYVMHKNVDIDHAGDSRGRYAA